MGYIGMNLAKHIPGTILKARSTRFPMVEHYGGVDWQVDAAGHPLVWHAQKDDVFRRTNFWRFSSGQPVEIVWVPPTHKQGILVINRFRALEGTPWRLSANCEHQIRWAVEGKAYSTQVNGALMGTLSLALLPAIVRCVGMG
jgi:hypothetical protein